MAPSCRSCFKSVLCVQHVGFKTALYNPLFNTRLVVCVVFVQGLSATVLGFLSELKEQFEHQVAPGEDNCIPFL